MSQTSGYDFSLTKAQVGQKYDLMFDQIDSFAAQGAVPFGLGLIKGTADDQAKVADSAAGVFVGAAVFTHTIENDGTVTGYADKDTVSVMRRGRMFVEAASALVVGAPAYVVVAAGADQGKFTDVSTDNLGPVGKFITSGADGDLVVVEINV
jgi:hypothetical protein